MHDGVWEPKEKSEKNVLILGESHYDEPDSQGSLSSYTTSSVVETYLTGMNIGTRFFSNIAESFGYSKSNYEEFYSHIYFGNYVDELCGVGNWNRASDFVNANRDKYNSELFAFCNQCKIDVIVCFSILCYNAMPKRKPGEKPQKEIPVGEIAGQKNCIRKYIYLPGEREDCSIPLDKEVILYGIRHPSSQSGYNAKQVYQYMAKEPSIAWLCK